jgi:Protein of unknown function (DUF3429)
MMNDSKRRFAQWLGYAGLVPFLSLAALLFWGSYQHNTDRFVVEVALLSYGAIILTFVGALSWAHAMHRDDLNASWMVWSVTPSLIAWLAMCATLFLVGSYPNATATILIAGFLVQLAADFRIRKLLPRDVFPDWFMRMRVHLTIAACVSLSVPLFTR